MIFSMLMRSQLKKPIAALLPMSFVWLFVACVSICVRESTEQHGHNSVWSPAEATDASDCRGCPMTAFPKATIPERAIQGFEPQTAVSIPSLIFAVDLLAADTASASRARDRWSPAPPLKRLPALRI